MKLSLISKKLKGIVVGSIVTDCSGDYPFGKVTKISDCIYCYWYPTLDDLKNERNVFKRYGSHRETFSTLNKLRLVL